MKTCAGWHESALDLGKYLQIGDPVDQEMADYFLNVLPPATMSGHLIQIGEPVNDVDGKPTFATLQKKRRPVDVSRQLLSWALHRFQVKHWFRPESEHVQPLPHL